MAARKNRESHPVKAPLPSPVGLSPYAWDRVVLPGPRSSGSSDSAQGWLAWREHLVGRAAPVPLAQRFPGRRGPLRWALPWGGIGPNTLDLLAQMERLTCREPARRCWQERLTAWLGAPSQDEAARALESVAWAHVLPQLVEAVPAAMWQGLLRRLLSMVGEARRVASASAPLAHQLLAGELPLVLAYSFPELAACQKLVAAGTRALESGLLKWLSPAGLPPATQVDAFSPLLACWTRVRVMAAQIDEAAWSRDLCARYRAAVGQSIRLRRPDGRPVFASRSGEQAGQDPLEKPGVRGGDGDLLAAAVHLADDEELRAMAAEAFPKHRFVGWQRGTPVLPKANLHAAEGGISILRPGWKPADPRVTVAYNAPTARVELSLSDAVLWSGAWDLEVRRDGRLLKATSPWEAICFESDQGVDFLEMELDLEGDVRVQRHLVVAGRDRFVYLADAVFGTAPSRWSYRSRLPLTPGVIFRPAEETREGLLAEGGRLRALLLPLALPEWRSDTRPGALSAGAAGLELTQEAEGLAMYAPLFVDLDPRRLVRPNTWRQLTVAENLAIVPSDLAVGYRVHVGRQQWLAYRSLGPSGNRTLLGHNLSSGTLVARFDARGEVETLVEIE